MLRRSLLSGCIRRPLTRLVSTRAPSTRSFYSVPVTTRQVERVDGVINTDGPTNTLSLPYDKTPESRDTVFPFSLFTIGATAALIYTTEKLFAEEQEPVENPTPLDWVKMRTMSSPEEIFSRFASVEGKQGEKFMTTNDFVRVITPFEFSCDLSSFEGDLARLINSVDVNKDGLISYSEFLCFTTLLSIPQKYTRVSFRMFDEDRSGDVDVREFIIMMQMISQCNPMTKSLKSPLPWVITKKEGIFPEFFGEKGEKKLTLEKFEEFIRELRDNVATVQFKILANGEEDISAKTFAKSIASYGDLVHRPEMEKKVERLSWWKSRVSMSDYKSFLRILQSLEELDFVLRSFVSSGQPFTKKQLQEAARAVCSVHLSDELLDIIFFVFDVDGDGKLDYNEFIGTLKNSENLTFINQQQPFLQRASNCLGHCWNQLYDRSG